LLSRVLGLSRFARVGGPLGLGALLAGPSIEAAQGDLSGFGELGTDVLQSSGLGILLGGLGGLGGSGGDGSGIEQRLSQLETIPQDARREVLDQAANSLPLLSAEELAALAREQGVIVPGGADLPGQNDLTDEQAQETGRVDDRAGVSERRREFILNNRTQLPSQNDLTDEQARETATTRGGESTASDNDEGISSRRREFIIDNTVNINGQEQREVERKIDESMERLKRDIRKELPRGVGP
jgi:hypothetical protein